MPATVGRSSLSAVNPDLEVEANRPVVLDVKNASTSLTHDLKMGGTTGTKALPPGGSEEINVGAVTDGAQAWCTIPGHKEAGMILTCKVKGASGATTAAGEASTATTTANPKDAVSDSQATPAAGWKPFDPALRPAPGGTEHKLTLSAGETVREVAPGVTQELWTFNGQVPGPILRGKVGDVFTVTLRNDGKMGHSIDFHASQVAWSDEMRTIQPGQSLVYQFKADYAGIFMYHCGTAPALHHIGNGMYGALIVDPPGLPKVDHEFVLVQSELYLGPQGQPGDLTKMQHDQWDAVVFNGYYNQYKFARRGRRQRPGRGERGRHEDPRSLPGGLPTAAAPLSDRARLAAAPGAAAPDAPSWAASRRRGARMPQPRSVVVAGRSAPRGAYPHLKIVGDTVFVSGTSARRPDGAVEGASVDGTGQVTRDIRVQTRAVLDNIAALLRVIGLSLDDVVEVTSFLVTMDDFEDYNEVYARYFSADTGPARTTVAVHQLPHPHLAIEIKAIAHAGGKDPA